MDQKADTRPKIALLIEARNFRNGYVDRYPGATVRYPGLIDVLEQETGGQITRVTVYSGHDPREPGPTSPARELWWLVDQAGPEVEIRWFPTKTKQYTCPNCPDFDYTITQDKQVDSAMTADAIDMIVDRQVDGVVFGTADLDVLPAVRAVERRGGLAWMAGWHMSQQADVPAIRMEGHVDRVLALPSSRPAPDARAAAGMLDELRRATVKFTGGYVGLHVFLTKWRGHQLSADARDRHAIIEELVRRGQVEVYVAPDGNKAVRVLEPAGQVQVPA